MRAGDFEFFDGGFIAMAHRGGAGFGPNLGRENTLSAFATAVRHGYRYIETDVHASSDGTVVVFHDDDLDRVCDLKGPIADHTWADLQAARIGEHERLATLDEVLEEFPDTRFNIDIKSERAIKPLVDVIVSHNAANRVCIASFSRRRMHAFLTAFGAPIAHSTPMSGVTLLRFIPVGSRLLASHIGCVLQVPITAKVAGVNLPILTPALIRRAHKIGSQVHVWTVDDAAAMNRLIDLGVDGIITDRIDVLAAVLRARRLWR